MAVQISGNDITVPRDGTFTRNVTIGGTLTYEDVTNIDSVGLVTARNGIVVGSGITLSKDGDIFATGVTTSTTLETLIKLKKLGVDSNRILLITAICSNKGLNEIAKLFPNQVIYTSCIDEEDDKTKLLVPGIGNPLLRLSTIFRDKN